jgi:hypothetical protein
MMITGLFGGTCVMRKMHNRNSDFNDVLDCWDLLVVEHLQFWQTACF